MRVPILLVLVVTLCTMLAACRSAEHRPYATEIQALLRRFSAVTYPESDFVRPAPIEAGQYVMYVVRRGDEEVITSYDVLEGVVDGWKLRREWMSPTRRHVDTFLLVDRELGDISRADGLEILLGQRGQAQTGAAMQVIGGVFKGTTVTQTEVKLNGRLTTMNANYNAAVLLTGLVYGVIGEVTVELLEFGRFRTALKF